MQSPGNLVYYKPMQQSTFHSWFLVSQLYFKLFVFVRAIRILKLKAREIYLTIIFQPVYIKVKF